MMVHVFVKNMKLVDWSIGVYSGKRGDKLILAILFYLGSEITWNYQFR